MFACTVPGAAPRQSTANGYLCQCRRSAQPQHLRPPLRPPLLQGQRCCKNALQSKPGVAAPLRGRAFCTRERTTVATDRGGNRSHLRFPIFSPARHANPVFVSGGSRKKEGCGQRAARQGFHHPRLHRVCEHAHRRLFLRVEAASSLFLPPLPTSVCERQGDSARPPCDLSLTLLTEIFRTEVQVVPAAVGAP